jgi:hypothetical protein
MHLPFSASSSASSSSMPSNALAVDAGLATSAERLNMSGFVLFRSGTPVCTVSRSRTCRWNAETGQMPDVWGVGVRAHGLPKGMRCLSWGVRLCAICASLAASHSTGRSGRSFSLRKAGGCQEGGGCTQVVSKRWRL